MENQLIAFDYLAFDYLNWRNEYHRYVVLPESIEYRPPSADSPQESERWVLNAHVVMRDGDVRPDMGKNRRRTFSLSGMHNTVDLAVEDPDRGKAPS